MHSDTSFELIRNDNDKDQFSMWRHMEGGNFRHMVKVENLHSHVALYSNCNVGNVYTDIQVYNKP